MRIKKEIDGIDVFDNLSRIDRLFIILNEECLIQENDYQWFQQGYQ
jgi:hypothetical protein